jgi:hypothetical protein
MIPRLQALITTLHEVPFDQYPAIMRQFQSEILG